MSDAAAAFGSLVQQGGAAALGSYLAGFLRSDRACHCICETLGGSPVLALLEKQLDRCGPEHLVRDPVPVDRCAEFWSRDSLLFALFVGLFFGSFLGWRLARAFPLTAPANRPESPASAESNDGGEIDRAVVQRQLRALRAS